MFCWYTVVHSRVQLTNYFLKGLCPINITVDVEVLLHGNTCRQNHKHKLWHLYNLKYTFHLWAGNDYKDNFLPTWISSHFIFPHQFSWAAMISLETSVDHHNCICVYTYQMRPSKMFCMMRWDWVTTNNSVTWVQPNWNTTAAWINSTKHMELQGQRSITDINNWQRRK